MKVHECCNEHWQNKMVGAKHAPKLKSGPNYGGRMQSAKVKEAHTPSRSVNRLSKVDKHWLSVVFDKNNSCLSEIDCFC